MMLNIIKLNIKKFNIFYLYKNIILCMEFIFSKMIIIYDILTNLFFLFLLFVQCIFSFNFFSATTNTIYLNE